MEVYHRGGLSSAEPAWRIGVRPASPAGTPGRMVNSTESLSDGQVISFGLLLYPPPRGGVVEKRERQSIMCKQNISYRLRVVVSFALIGALAASI